MLERYADHEGRKLTGIDTLNFGVGGYGVDQIFIHFTRSSPSATARIVVSSASFRTISADAAGGAHQPEALLTIRDDKLVLHTAHIHADAMSDFFGRLRTVLSHYLRAVSAFRSTARC